MSPNNNEEDPWVGSTLKEGIGFVPIEEPVCVAKACVAMPRRRIRVSDRRVLPHEEEGSVCRIGVCRHKKKRSACVAVKKECDVCRRLECVSARRRSVCRIIGVCLRHGVCRHAACVASEEVGVCR